MLQCVSACTDRLCAQNKVVTQGITAPLEVFHTGAAQDAPASSQRRATCAMPRPAAAVLRLWRTLAENAQQCCQPGAPFRAFLVPSTGHTVPVRRSCMMCFAGALPPQRPLSCMLWHVGVTVEGCMLHCPYLHGMRTLLFASRLRAEGQGRPCKTLAEPHRTPTPQATGAGACAARGICARASLCASTPARSSPPQKQCARPACDQAGQARLSLRGGGGARVSFSPAEAIMRMAACIR